MLHKPQGTKKTVFISCYAATSYVLKKVFLHDSQVVVLLSVWNRSPKTIINFKPAGKKKKKKKKKTES